MAQPTRNPNNLPSVRPTSAPSVRQASSPNVKTGARPTLSNKPTQRPAPTNKTYEKPLSHSLIKSNNNAYKKGKLSKNARFSPRKIKWKPIIILLCVLASIISALILGNFLNKKVEKSQNTTIPRGDISNINPPSADKVTPQSKLHAYFTDLRYADPNTSLSELTGEARNQGNALFVNLKNENGEIIYTSDKVTELGFTHQENLALNRLKNHFEYYDDFAIAFFKSDFSSKIDEETALKIQTNEILLLKEATDIAFGQIIIEFSGNITKSNLIYYQTYLLNLKLACPETPIGVVLKAEFLNDANNAGSVAGILDIADCFTLDFGESSAEEILNTLSPMIYFTSKYNCIIMLSSSSETPLVEKIATLKDNGFENYIVK